MAKVVKSFRGVRDGEIYPVVFAVGDTVEGNLAKVAIAEGWATDGVLEVAPAAPKAKRKK